SDIVSNLGMALLAARQPGRARELFEHVLAYFRATGDRFGEKLALERLGLAASSMRDPTRALALFEQALAIARQLGDRQQEANLIWQQGIQHAERGERELAISKSEEAITLLKLMGRPQAGWYGAQLQKYRMGLFDERSGAPDAGGGAGLS